MVALRVGALTVGAAVVQCAETQSTALGRGSAPASFRQASPVSPGSRARVGDPWETKRLGSVGSDMGDLAVGCPLSGSPLADPQPSAPRGCLGRDDQHAVDAPTVHVDHLEAEALHQDTVRHLGHAIDARHHEAAEGLEIVAVLARKPRQAGEILYLV